MKNQIGILVAAALAVASAPALAAKDPVKIARDTAKETYKMDKRNCSGNGFTDAEHDRCMHQAKAKYDQQMIEVKNLKTEEKADDKAEKKEAKLHADGASVGSSKRPMPGSQGEKGERTAVHPPLSSMGKAPVSANTPYTGDPTVDQRPK